MSVGDRIKRVRNFKGFTQRELGIRAGFDENTADVRINQYEAGLRKPKEEIMTRIADALEVNYRSLYERNCSVPSRINVKFQKENT